MIKVKTFAPVLVIGSLVLVGCSPAQNQPPAEPTAETANPIAEAQQVAEGSYPQLLEVVTKTLDAVNAQDFDQAKTEFDQFEAVWSTVEDGIKDQAPDSYDAIESDMDEVNAALKSAQPEAATTALQKMADDIKVIPPN